MNLNRDKDRYSEIIKGKIANMRITLIAGKMNTAGAFMSAHSENALKRLFIHCSWI